MSKTTTPKPETERQSGLPIVESVGWTKLSQGWVVMHLWTQGDRVVRKEVIKGPEIKLIAAEALKLALVRKLLSAKQ